jgi:hypothetical protein
MILSNFMPRLKTLLTPEEQWQRTVEYVRPYDPRYDVYDFRIEDYSARSLIPKWRNFGILVVASYTNRLLCRGDVFVLQSSNGMCERYAVSGVSSKGFRLKHYYLKLNSCTSNVIHLPDDMIDRPWWDDWAIGHYVANLRINFLNAVVDENIS